MKRLQTVFCLLVFFSIFNAQAKLAVWSEFLDAEKVERHFEFLKVHHIDLHLAVRSHEISQPGLFGFIRKAQQQGIEVRPWILLEEEKGYWANVWNAEEFRQTVLYFLTRAKEERVPVKWISIDLESPPRQLKAAAACLSHKDIWCASKVFSENQNSFVFWKAHATFQKMIDDVHRLDVKLHAVTAPMVLHDFADGLPQFQFLFGVPVQGLDWDELSFMVYRPEFINLLGPIGSDIVYEYAKMAKRYVGAKAAIDLGEIGSSVFPIPVKGFQKPEELISDLRAVREARITEINLYSLDGLSTMPNPDLWIQTTGTNTPAPSWKTKFYFSVIQFVKKWLPLPGR
ncbi:MAG: hypothetical protein AB7F59_01845 [Bdellovibrionales bacterium]